MRLLDTVVFVGALNPLDQHHRAATRHLASLISDPDVFVPTSTLLELDLLFKARGYTTEERYQTWLELTPKIPAEKTTVQTATSFAVASELESEGMDYFDALLTARSLELGAKIVTDDKDIAKRAETQW